MSTNQCRNGATKGKISVKDVNLNYDDPHMLKPGRRFPFRIVTTTAQQGVVGTRTGSHVEERLEQLADASKTHRPPALH